MLVKVALPLILAFIMFSLGVGLRVNDFTRVIKFPKAFGTGLFNQLILLPLVAFGIVTAFKISPELAVSVMILSFCPGGVTSNVLTRLANGNTPLSISLTAVTSLLSIITVPLLVAVSVKHFMGEHEAQINVTLLGIKMFLLTAVPVGLGMLLRAKAPSLVEKISRTISRIAMVLFVLIIIAALAVNRVVVFSNLAALGPALILINIGMLGLGLASSRLLRLETKDATTISLESGVQNGTLGIAVGAMIAANASDSLPPTTVASAVYGITMYFVSLPFVFWRKMAVKE
ncbi:MAG: bile acid:sodium symporter [Verrucomicrobiales bacterium]|nr:bile acid:sodium symporter [Verrucomicrobiales bacterium]|tara:strand:+ start:8897 stop:9760 length:864 start_codon:yes stop_codon:yes gene_type:complete